MVRLMRRVVCAGVACAAVTVPTGGCAVSPARTVASGTPSGAAGWRVTATLTGRGIPVAITASDRANAWEVSDTTRGLADSHALAFRHWNGVRWQAVAAPKVFPYRDEVIGAIGAIAAAPPSGAIVAVGRRLSEQTGLARWTGTAWEPAVRLGTKITMDAAVAPAAQDAWVFGYNANWGPGDTGYALHYSSGKWHPARVPVNGETASATSPGDVWVLGTAGQLSGKAAAMVYNGARWRVVSLPRLGAPVVRLFGWGIAAVSADSAWVLVSTGSLANQKPVLLHWQGGHWTVIKVPYAGQAGAFNAPLAADGHGGVWLTLDDPARNTLRSYLAHYTDGRWSRVTLPAGRGYVMGVKSLATIPGSRALWAVGVEQPLAHPMTGFRPVILKYTP